MASLLPRPARLICSTLRSQGPRPAILAWQTSHRAASTTVTPLTSSTSNTPPQSPGPTTAAGTARSHIGASIPKARQSHAKHKKAGSDKRIVARVAKAGFMDKTVRVEIATHVWHNYLRKFYRSSQHMLVHDPANSLREGDMIHVRRLPAPRTNQVHHVVHEILVPFGVDIADRPPVPTEKELEQEHAVEYAEKLTRRTLRHDAERGDEEAARQVKELGIGIKEIVSGRGRSRRVRTVLEKDYTKGKK